jgi:hypothetical protein
MKRKLSEMFEYRALEKVKKNPGIYAWYLDIDDKTDLKKFQKFFSSKQFNVSIDGNLRESYEGKVYPVMTSTEYNFKDLSILSGAVYEFGVPIYIGVSTNLFNRLLEHKKALEFELSCGHSRSISKLNDGNSALISLDTNEESSIFAKRVSESLIANDISAALLRVKVIYCPEIQDRSELFAVEKFVNRLYYPILGRN